MKKFATTALMLLLAGSAYAARMPSDGSLSKATIKAIQAGDAAITAKDYPAAIAAYTIAIDSKELKGDPLASILINRGISYYSIQQCPSAIPDFDKSIEIAREPNAQAYAGRGQCYMDTGKSAEGVADFKQAVALKPEDASFAGALCSATFNAKIYLESGPACEAYLVFVPDNAQIMEATAASYQYAGNKAKALEMWQRLLALDPNSAIAKQGIEQNS